MTPRQRLFANGLMRATISQPVMAISIRDRDGLQGGHGYDLPTMCAPLLNPALDKSPVNL